MVAVIRADQSQRLWRIEKDMLAFFWSKIGPIFALTRVQLSHQQQSRWLAREQRFKVAVRIGKMLDNLEGRDQIVGVAGRAHKSSGIAWRGILIVPIDVITRVAQQPAQKARTSAKVQ